MIRANGTIFCSLLYLDSRLAFRRLKYIYSIISVTVDLLPGNTEIMTIDLFRPTRVRFLHSWAVYMWCAYMCHDWFRCDIALCLDACHDSHSGMTHTVATAVVCSERGRIALSPISHTFVRWSFLQHIAAHCNTLQHTAAHYNTLQHTATHHSC